MCCFVILLLSNEMQMSVRRFSAIPHLRGIRHTNYSRQPSTPKIIDTRLNIGPSVGMTSKPFEFSNV